MIHEPAEKYSGSSPPDPSRLATGGNSYIETMTASWRDLVLLCKSDIGISGGLY